MSERRCRTVGPIRRPTPALSVDDEIVAVNGGRVDMNLQTLLSSGAAGYEVSVFRQNRLLTVSTRCRAGQQVRTALC